MDLAFFSRRSRGLRLGTVVNSRASGGCTVHTEVPNYIYGVELHGAVLLVSAACGAVLGLFSLDGSRR